MQRCAECIRDDRWGLLQASFIDVQRGAGMTSSATVLLTFCRRKRLLEALTGRSLPQEKEMEERISGCQHDCLSGIHILQLSLTGTRVPWDWRPGLGSGVVQALVVVLNRRGVSSLFFASFFRCCFFRVGRRQMKICMRIIRIILLRLLNFQRDHLCYRRVVVKTREKWRELHVRMLFFSRCVRGRDAKLYMQSEEHGLSLCAKFCVSRTNGSPVMGQRLFKRMKTV